MTEHTKQYSPNDHMYSTTGGHFSRDKTLDMTQNTAKTDIRRLRPIFPNNHRQSSY